MVQHIDAKINGLRDEIKECQEQLQQAVVIKENKMKFNEAAKELMKYDKKVVIDEKLQNVREEIK